jgi:hypothetical protein
MKLTVKSGVYAVAAAGCPKSTTSQCGINYRGN